MRKVIGVWGGVACRIIVSAPVPLHFLWTLDFGFGTWIWDLYLGLGSGTGLGLDNVFISCISCIFDYLLGLKCRLLQ